MLIKSENFLKADTKFEGCICCVNTPDVTIPIQLFLYNPVNYGMIQAPQGWAPQVMPMYDI